MARLTIRKSLHVAQLAVCLLIAWVAIAPPSQGQNANKSTRSLYTEDRQKTREALERKDDKALREALLQLRKDFPGRSAVPEELAGVEARLGNDAAALNWLQQSVEMGLVPHLDDSAFDALKKSGKLDSLLKQIEESRKLVSHSSSVFRLGSSDLLTEDIAYDARAKRFLISSVRQRKILSCDHGGKSEDFISGADASLKPLWAIFALQIDPTRRYLWATTASVPFEAAHEKNEEGRCALLKFDLQSRKLVHRYDCDATEKHEMGDMTVASNGDVFVSDGASGDVFVLRHDGQRLERLVPNGTFVAPQTPTLSADQRFLYVPDYVVGIAAVRLSDASIEWVTSKTPAALDGIDGLYAIGGKLIAIQNGTSPERVVAFQLNGPHQVDGWEALEANWPDLGDPTHGVLNGSEFYFIANSGWDRVDSSGAMTPGKPAEIRKLAITGR
jgi:sugar lactone lactonase YvrE